MKALNAIFRPAQFTGWHMLGIMGLFFGTIICVNLVLAFNAASTWTGLIVQNTYVESQKFDARKQELAAQNSLGWKAEALVTSNALKVALTDKAGRPVSDAIVTGFLGRPVHEGADQTLTLNFKDDAYHLPKKLAPGQWRIQIYAISNQGQSWTQTLRFTVPKIQQG